MTFASILPCCGKNAEQAAPEDAGTASSMSGALRSLFRSCAGTVDGLQNHAGGTKAEEEVPQPEADSEAEKEERPLTIEEARRLAEKMSGEFVVVPDQ